MKKNMVLSVIFYLIVALILIGLIYWFGIRPYQNQEKMLNITTGTFIIVADKTDSGKEFNTFPIDGKTMVSFLWKDKDGRINKQYVKFENIDFSLNDAGVEQVFVNFNVSKDQFDYLDLFSYDTNDHPSCLVDNGQKITIKMIRSQYNYYFSDIPIGDYQY